MRGAVVTVLRPSAPTRDSYGRLVKGKPTEERVRDVLYAPAQTADFTEDDDATFKGGDGMSEVFHFPKTWKGSLAGCRIRTPDGIEWDVTGDPQPYMTENCPTRWNRKVLATRHTAKEAEGGQP